MASTSGSFKLPLPSTARSLDHRPTGDDLLALASAFRDLFSSPAHAAAIAAVVDGCPPDTLTLRKAIAAWSSLPANAGVSPGVEVRARQPLYMACACICRVLSGSRPRP